MRSGILSRKRRSMQERSCKKTGSRGAKARLRPARPLAVPLEAKRLPKAHCSGQCKAGKAEQRRLGNGGHLEHHVVAVAAGIVDRERQATARGVGIALRELPD